MRTWYERRSAQLRKCNVVNRCVNKQTKAHSYTPYVKLRVVHIVRFTIKRSNYPTVHNSELVIKSH